MTTKTATNPYGLPDHGYPTAVPVFFSCEMSYSENFARALLAQVWEILHNGDVNEASRSHIRLTWQRPSGKFGPFANHGVVRIVDRSLGQMIGRTGSGSIGLWQTIPNKEMTERACFASCADGSDTGIYALSRTVAHEMGHCCSLKDLTGPEGRLMVSTSAPSWRTLLPEERAAYQDTFQRWAKMLI